jgi:zinc transport system substrate-binding protein
VSARLLIASALAVGLAACSSSGTAQGKIPVTAAFYPLAFLAERIGGSAVAVTNLTPPGAEPHDLELKPSDVRSIRGARLVLYLRGLQPAVDDAVRAFNGRAASDALTAVHVRRAADGSIDAHFWLDPELFSKVAGVVEQRLEAVAPDKATMFRSNLRTLSSELSALDAEFRKGLSSCAHHEVFTGHAAFGYMAARYGFEQIAITGLNPESEPSPRQLSNIIQRARQLRPRVVYAEELVSSRSIDAVARAVGAKVEVLNPLEGLLPAEARAGQDYVSLMHRDLNQLEEGLSCRTTP